jgi:hypothetical protein
MKKTSLLVASALLASSALFAQDSVTSNVVGYVTSDAPAGSSLASFPFQHAAQFEGSIDTVAGTALSISGLPGTIETPSYVHVTSGTALGSVVSITASDASSVTLENSISGLSDGDTIKIVKHMTLADLTAASGSSIADGSVVTVYNADGTTSVYTTYFNTWYDSSFGSADGVIVFPGEGVALGLTSATSFTYVGTVSDTATNVPLTAGVVNIVGSTVPAAPASTSGNLGTALASSLADGSTVTLYSNDGSLTAGETYTVYFGTWYDSSFGTADISIAAPSVAVVGPVSSATASMPSGIN